MLKKNTQSKKIILGSSSPRRIELLSHLKYSIEVIKPTYVEQPYKQEVVTSYVIENARLKALSIINDLSSQEINYRPIISADTIVYIDHKVLGKPKDKSESFEMLSTLSGKTHSVFTGYCLALWDHSTKDFKLTCHYNETTVTLKKLSEAEIRDYIETGEPSDKAGSYAIQGKGSYMIDQIEGSYTNVMGLPLSHISDLLKEKGV